MAELGIQNVNIWKSNGNGDWRACVLFGKDWDNLLIRRSFQAQTLTDIWDKIAAEAVYLQRSSAGNDHAKS